MIQVHLKPEAINGNYQFILMATRKEAGKVISLCSWHWQILILCHLAGISAPSSSFFVFDYHCDNYLVLQDGKERRFHSLKTEWGLAKLLSLELFNDPSKGYLVDDCCAFGVEMFFQKSEFKGEYLSIISDPANETYTWKIDKFSTFTQYFHESDMFTIGRCKWRLRFYPKGDSQSEGENLSVFLCLRDNSSLPSGWKIFRNIN